MAQRGGQPGNKNATKDRPWTEAVQRVLKRYEDPEKKIQRGMALERIAEECVKAALDGDPVARAEIANRLDGKPTERKEVTKTTRIIRETRISAIRSALRGVPAEQEAGGRTLQ
jgi:hypothetical protein